jgi:Rod binding domain-containing protein
MQIDSPAIPPGVPRHPAGRIDGAAGTDGHEALRTVARDLEAAFLAEMLKHSGLGAGSDAFGGGVGETQFASFLTQEHARLFAERGGIGLAEGIFRALVAREGA